MGQGHHGNLWQSQVVTPDFLLSLWTASYKPSSLMLWHVDLHMPTCTCNSGHIPGYFSIHCLAIPLFKVRCACKSLPGNSVKSMRMVFASPSSYFSLAGSNVSQQVELWQCAPPETQNDHQCIWDYLQIREHVHKYALALWSIFLFY